MNIDVYYARIFWRNGVGPYVEILHHVCDRYPETNAGAELALDSYVSTSHSRNAVTGGEYLVQINYTVFSFMVTCKAYMIEAT